MDQDPNLDIEMKDAGKSERVTSIDLHPSETWILTSLYSGIVCIWDYKTQRVANIFKVAEVPVWSAKFIAQKKWVVSGADDMLIHVNDYDSKDEVKVLHGHTDGVRCLAVHPTLPYMLSSSNDKLIKLWNWEDGWSCAQTLQVTFDPKDTNTFASSSSDGTIKIWDINSSVCCMVTDGERLRATVKDLGNRDLQPQALVTHLGSADNVWDKLKNLNTSEETNQWIQCRLREIEKQLLERKADGHKDENIAAPEHSFPYVGLANTGCACYSNSLLQILFHVPYFRKAVLQMSSPTTEDGNSVTSALKKLFRKLQFGGTFVETKEFTTAFGWDRTEHHDVHEFLMALFQKLDDEGPGLNDTKEQFFLGHYRTHIQCCNINVSERRVEPFLGLQLVVEGCDDVYDSFDRYVEIQRIKYNAGKCGFQDAFLSYSFIDFPRVLLLQLRRFDFSEGTASKINDRFKYQLELDLSRDEYLVYNPDEGVRIVYTLHSVLVHEGDVWEGHYYVYIRPTLADRWFKFDDESVEEVDQEMALVRQFGGEEMLKYNNLGNAYMLTYIREDVDEMGQKPSQGCG